MADNIVKRTAREQKPIALRITDPTLEKKVMELSKKQNLSLNMTVNMLLGYAFNEVNRQGKEFKSKIVFETDSQIV